MSPPELPPIENLPAVSLGHFYHSYTTSGKRLFIVLWGTLLVGLLLLLYFVYHPTSWVLSLRPITEAGSSQVVIEEVTSLHRTLPMWAEAYFGFVSYSAGLIAPSLALTIILAVLQAVGFSALLAGSSRVEGFWVYALYFLVALALLHSEASFLFTPDNPYKLISLLIILAFLVPAYLFKVRALDWGIPQQFVFFMALYALLFGLAYALQGFVGLHRTATYPLPLLVLVMVFTFLFTARDLVNLVVYACTNQTDKARRLGPWVIVGICLALLLPMLILALQYYRWVDLGELYLRPIHLFVVCAALTVFTSQNIYHQLRDVIPSNLAFAVLVLGLCTLTTGVLVYINGSAEHMLRLHTEQLIIFFYTFVGALYLLYILLHFWRYLQGRVNIYYVLLEPPVPTALRMFAVWFIAITFIVMVEGSTSWRTVILARKTSTNMMGDNALLAGDYEVAKAMYRSTLYFPNNLYPSDDPKANYNFAGLEIGPKASLRVIGPYYERAGRQMRLPAANLNHGNLCVIAGNAEAAKRALLLYADEEPSAHVYANLAALYRRQGDADSAIIALKQAIALDPNNGVLYGNLALLYEENDRRDIAEQMLRAALDVAPKDPYVLQNATYLSLLWPKQKEFCVCSKRYQSLDTTLTANLRYNMGLMQLREHDYLYADSTATLLLRQAELPQVLHLKMVSQAQRDSLDNAISRYTYLKTQYPQYAALAGHNLGMTFFGKAMPEMATEYLTKSAREGLRVDSFYAALMWMDAGWHDRGLRLLDQTRANQPALWRAAQREAAIVLRANGSYEAAALEWNFANMTTQEGLRMARLALQADNIATAIDSYVRVAQRDSQTLAPYLELADYYFSIKRDSLALDNLLSGLSRDSNNVKLRAAIARGYLRIGNRKVYAREVARLKSKHEGDSSVQLLLAEQLYADRQYDAALAIMQASQASRRYDLVFVDLAMRCLQAKGQYQEGVQWLAPLIKVNAQSHVLWAWYARMCAGASLDDAARHAAKEAVRTAYNKKLVDGYRQEFASLLAPVATDH